MKTPALLDLLMSTMFEIKRARANRRPKNPPEITHQLFMGDIPEFTF